MNLGNTRVVVTGVSALIGQGIITSLQNIPDMTVIGVDKKFTQYAYDISTRLIIKPECDENSEEYLSFWRNLIIENNIKLVFPGISSDIDFFVKYAQILRKLGCEVVLNNLELIQLCDDKWLFNEELKKNDFVTIPTSISRNWNELRFKLGEPPFILKPRKGEGSQGIVLINDRTDFEYWSEKNSDNYIVQTIVGDAENEFTVGTFGLGGGEIIDDVIIMRRKLSRAGNTALATIVFSEKITEIVKKLVSIFRPIGPTNFQFRLDNKIPYLLEINPRFSSSTSMKASFGFNEAAMSVDFYLHNKTPECSVDKNGTIERRWQDVLWSR